MRSRFQMSLGVLLVAGTAAMAQVHVRLDVGTSTVLKHEPLMVRVVVQNDGGAPLIVNAPGGSGPQLRFNVEHNNGRRARRRQNAGRKQVAVPAGEARVIEADVTKYVDVTAPDRYFVRAVIEGAGGEARSTLKQIDVVPGLEVARTVGAVALAPGVRRTYSLRYWPRNQEEHIFLCVSDVPTGRVFEPVYLGTLVRVVQPTLELGADGIVTVVHQVNRSQVMVSTLNSQRDRLTLVTQKPERIAAGAPRKAPGLPRP